MRASHCDAASQLTGRTMVFASTPHIWFVLVSWVRVNRGLVHEPTEVNRTGVTMVSTWVVVKGVLQVPWEWDVLGVVFAETELTFIGVIIVAIVAVHKGVVFWDALRTSQGEVIVSAVHVWTEVAHLAGSWERSIVLVWGLV